MSKLFCLSPGLRILERQMQQPPGYRPRGYCVVYVDAAFFISQHKKLGSHMELKKLCGFADVNINNV